MNFCPLWPRRAAWLPAPGAHLSCSSLAPVSTMYFRHAPPVARPRRATGLFLEGVLGVLTGCAVLLSVCLSLGCRPTISPTILMSNMYQPAET